MSYFSQPGVFNVLDAWDSPTVLTGMVAGTTGITFADAQANAEVLQAAILAAQNAAIRCGNKVVAGEVLIPGHSLVPSPVNNPLGHTDAGGVYLLAVPTGQPAAVSISCNWPVIIKGTGNVRLVMYKDLHNDNGGDMFQIATDNADNDNNIGGITFEDIDFGYSGFSTPQTYTAIHCLAEGVQNLRVNRCVFTDCPQSIWIENGLQSSITANTFRYTSGGNIGTSILLGNGAEEGDKGAAKKVYIDGCVFRADHGLGGSTALLIKGCDQVRMSDCDIDSYFYGIMIQPGPYGNNSVHLFFDNVTVNVGTAEAETGAPGSAVVISPLLGVTQTLYVGQVVFTSCTFEYGETAVGTAAPGFPGGVYVNAALGPIDTVRFVSCYSTRWPMPGLTIDGGAKHIEVLGGMYAGNNSGTGAFASTQPYGIWIIEAEAIRVVGANCLGKYTFITLEGNNTSPVQHTGIYIDSQAVAVIVDGCDLRNNANEGVHVVGGASDVMIDGCDVTGGTNGIKIDASSAAIANVFIRNCNATGYGGYTTAVMATGSAANLASLEVVNTPGYNDWSPSLFVSVLPGTQFHNYNYSYYGPLSLFVPPAARIVAVKVGGVSTGLVTGSFVIPPNVVGEIDASGGIGAVTATLIGQ